MNFVNSEFAKTVARKFTGALSFFALAFLLSAIQIFPPEIFGQINQTKPASEISPPPAQNLLQNLPKVTRIDSTALKNLIKRADSGANSKPLLVNFWATWCDPCREEFPDLVKIGDDYKNKIDFITISLDELSDIDGDVPKFLARMKATTPAFLLKTEDEESAISEVSKNWQGGLPFTILYDARGAAVYTKQGKVKPEILRAQIDKILPAAQIQTVEPESKSAFVINDLDEAGLRALVKPKEENPRPLLINFWATWCGICQSEFPDLVEIDRDFRARGLETVTISIDDLYEKTHAMPPFLQQMKATMPAYLLDAKDKTAAKSIIALWSGGVPTTILYNGDGKISYFFSGRLNPRILRREIELVLPKK